MGVRNNFDKFLQELADHPLFPEAKQVNIEKLRQVPRFVEKKNELEDEFRRAETFSCSMACFFLSRIHCFEGLVVSKEALSWARKVLGGGFSMDTALIAFHQFI